METNQPQEQIQGEVPARPRVSVPLPKTRPIVTYILIALSVLVYAVQFITEKHLGQDLPLVWGAKYRPFIDVYHQYWRFVTPIFLHGSITHIAFNMYSLWIVGREMERFLGHGFYLAFYLVAGIAGNVFSYIFSPLSVSVGASTALFGLIAGETLFAYKNRKLFPAAARVYKNDLSILAVNLLLGMQSKIDNWGHLGGLVGGALIAWFAAPLYKVEYRPDQEHFTLIDIVTKKQRCLVISLVLALFILLALLF